MQAPTENGRGCGVDMRAKFARAEITPVGQLDMPFDPAEMLGLPSRP